MKNKVLSGDTITIPAPAGGVVSGGGVLIGTVLGVAVTTAAAGVDVAVQLEGVFTLPKLNTDVVALGVKLYWDNVNFRLTTTAGANAEAGIAFTAVGNPSTSVAVKLKGR